MLAVILSILNIFLLSLGAGLLSRGIVVGKTPFTDAEDLIKTLLTGFLIVLALSSWLCIVAPVNSLTNVILSVVSSVVLLWHGPLRLSACPSWPGSWRSAATLLLIPILLLFLVSLWFSAQIAQIPDTWFYHYQAIQWIQTFGTVKGLGNLFSNLAYTSSIFSGNALFDLSPLTGSLVFPINIFLWLLGIIWLFIRTLRHYKQSQHLQLLAENILFFLLFRYAATAISSSSPDPASAILIFFVFFLVADSLQQTTGLLNRTCLIMLIASLPGIKLINLPFLVLFIALPKPKSILLPAGLLILPLMIRSYLLSGYPFYPLEMGGWLHPDWQIPQVQVIYEEWLIRSWAIFGTLPDSSLPVFPVSTWFHAWISSAGLLNGFIMVVAVLSLMATLFFILTNPNKNYRLLTGFAFALAASMLLWLGKAPAPRFIQGMLISATILPLILPWKKNLVMPMPAIVFCIISLAVFTMFTGNHTSGMRYPGTFSWVKPSPIPTTTTEMIDFNGIRIHYADPAQSIFSFASPIPTTPQLRKGLMLRGTLLSDGFRIHPDSLTPDDKKPASIKKYYQSRHIRSFP